MVVWHFNTLWCIWKILWPFGIYYGNLVYLMAIWYILRHFGISFGRLVVYFNALWYILWPFGTYFHILKCCTKKNLKTLTYMTYKYATDEES
jgi:hypothetical protein